MIGQVIGNYRVSQELGRGGMGMVYAAEHVQLGRPAALKMLLPQLSADPAIVQRFFNEARAASAIEHPGIVAVYDYGTHTDGRAYIVMELLKGESLEHRLRRGSMTPQEAAAIVAQVAGALAAAHARGIVHRDLKPDNIFLVPNELVAGGIQVKVLDFGIAKLAGEQGGGMKTQTGALIGTPAYMSPEQCMGRSDLDHRTDLYSLGCVFYHMLCGRPPFVSDQGTGMILAAHMRDAAPPLPPSVPAPLAAITMRLLEKEPAKRYQSAAEVRAALVDAGVAAPPTKPPAVSGQNTPSGYEPTMAPGAVTTNSGSAAQMLAAPTVAPAPGARGKGMWIGIAAVLAVGAGIAVFVATQGSKHDDKVAAAQPPAPAAVPASAAVPAAVPAPPAVPAVAPPLEACPTGMERDEDTQGHCCWPDQAWSSAKNKCIGKPTCPKGFVAKGEACAEPPVVVPAANVSPEHFGVAASTVKAGEPVAIVFPAPLQAKHGEQYWAAIVAVGQPDSEWGVWSYVPDAARRLVLKAPTSAGDYEVRLHGNYPTKSFNVVHRVRIHVE
ncbi:MAG: serine/threonine protein kinase [Deltaproteobacteria bacterium]|nr:serine/threonine protein kinase [Deltaproteobacteria bacterium]